ncbi:MAG: Ig-like domain-containing protein [archaeon]
MKEKIYLSFVLSFLILISSTASALTAGGVAGTTDYNFISGEIGTQSGKGSGGNYDFNFMSSSFPTGHWAGGAFDFNTGLYSVNRYPSVTITNPTNGTTITVNQVTLQFSASDPDGTVSKYWIKQDNGQWLDNGSSTSKTFNSVTNGQHTFYVKAADTWDENGSASSITLTFSYDTSGSGDDEDDTGSGSPGGGSSGGGGGIKQPDRECSNNNDCAKGAYCNANKCVECLTNNECTSAEYCTNNYCADVKGVCGIAVNHKWLEFECCSNVDCGPGNVCNSSTHNCQAIRTMSGKRLEIHLNPEQPIAGNNLMITITDAKGKIITDAELTLDNKQVRLSPDGSYEFYPQNKLYVLRAAKNGFEADYLEFTALLNVKLTVSNTNPAKGDLIEISLTDLDGLPLGDIELLIVFPDGTSQIIKTNAQGIALMQALEPGTFSIQVAKTGYVTANQAINVQDIGGQFNLSGNEGIIAVSVIIIIVIVFAGLYFIPKTQGRKKNKFSFTGKKR